MDIILGIRIVAYYGLYVAYEWPSQPLWDGREGHYIIIEHILKQYKIEV
jgi:hypothetical protein